jgi:hypothetical protein
VTKSESKNTEPGREEDFTWSPASNDCKTDAKACPEDDNDNVKNFAEKKSAKFFSRCGPNQRGLWWHAARESGCPNLVL